MAYNKTQESVSALFHKVLHNFGDWELETAYMNRIERSIYFDMRTLYLKSGQPLTSDLELLARRIRCNDEAELKALEFILKDKFIYDKKRSVYRHREWDLMIKNYKFRHRNDNEVGNDMVTNSNDRALSNADRQARFKERKRMLKELENKGVVVDGGMSFSDVAAIYNGHFPHVVNEIVTKGNVGNENGNDGNEKNNAKNEAITNNHKPTTNNLNIKTSITQSADADAVVCAGVELVEENQKPKKPSKADAWKALLAENGIVGQLADDYVAIRVAKNAPLTATAMEGLKREAAKAGMTLEQAITYSTEQGWQGFKAEWLLNKVFGNQSKPQNRINDLPKHTQGGAFLAKDIF